MAARGRFQWRAQARRFFPYFLVAATGFLLAYLVAFFVLFPSDVIPSDTKVPNVVGLPYDDAGVLLRKAGFEAGVGERRYHAAAPPTTVLQQTPPAGSVEPKGARIVLDVSAGVQRAAVPAVVGVTLTEARRLIEQAGFDVGDVLERASDRPAGEVAETFPVSGEQVPLPATVNLIVSQGAAQVVVPLVVGRGEVEARTLLEQVGLRAQTTLGTADSLAGAAATPLVVGQAPAAGARVATGTVVRLTVAAPGGGTP